jgi:hypothetical protein
MEKKLTALILIILLVGLGGGFGLGYTIYQPKVESLQKTLDDLSAEIATTEPQPKVITLLKESNITNLQGWNISVDTSGYRTGFLYCQIAQAGNAHEHYASLYLIIRFQVDDILGWNVESSEQNLQVSPPSPYIYAPPFKEISIASNKMWLSTSPSYDWAVLSISLYLRD